MRNVIITGILLVVCILFLLLRSWFIPAIFFSAAALCFTVWQGVVLIRQKDIQRAFEVRLLPFLASLLFLALVIMVLLTIAGGLGHGGRASAILPLKWLLTFLVIFVVPASIVLFARYHRMASPDRQRVARLYAGAATLALIIIFLTVAAEMAGWPPILYASRTGSRDLEKRLIAFGVDVNVRDRYSGWDPLTYTAWYGDVEMTALLLAAGARVYDPESRDWPALVQASMKGHADIVRQLLKQVDQADGKNLALCFSARHGNPAVVNILLDAGADMHTKSRFGRTALQEACKGGYPAVVRLLLERSPVVVPVLDKCGNALLVAAREEDLALLQLLLDKGVDVNYQNEVKWTALMVAAQKGSARTMNFLLDKSANPNVRDAQERTALRIATQAGHDSVRELLLQRGARE